MDSKIELELGVFCCCFFLSYFCGMFWSLSPHTGDSLPKGNLWVEHRVPVLNVLHLVALKHEFAWLSLAVCKTSFNFMCVLAAPGSSVFGLHWLSMLVKTCDTDGQNSSLLLVDVHIGCQYNLWGEWNVPIWCFIVGQNHSTVKPLERCMITSYSVWLN